MNEKRVLILEEEKDFITIKKIGIKSLSNVDFIHAMSSEKAIDILNYAIKTNPNYLPDIIIINLDFLKKECEKVLDFIQTHSNLHIIPIIVLETPNTHELTKEIFENYPNCIISKPQDEKEFEKVLENIFFFWFNIAKLPNKNFALKPK